MVHDDVLDGATQVHDEAELVGHAVLPVAHLERATARGGHPALHQHVATVGGGHIDAGAAQQGDVLHDDLSAHALLGRKVTATHGRLGRTQALDDQPPALLSADASLAHAAHAHGAPYTRVSRVPAHASSTTRCLRLRSRMGAECVRAPDET